ncbi:MAG: hypothetical protein J0L84_06190 [Verrucomicrobia bacterium]|nr:hypothetical protein [Verrucomicrobiota bacterium]
MVFHPENLDWESDAGRLIDRLAASLPATPRMEINVFGSAPLQLLVERSFLSAGVDLFTTEDDSGTLAQWIAAQRLNTPALHFEVCEPLAFRSTFDWQSRAVESERHGHRIRFVHPWDVLVSKVQRLEEKDLHAFRRVIQQTGHPTEAEFLRHLQKAVDLYRPRFDEEDATGDMTANTRRLWHEIWNREMDPRVEIIRPAIERANRAFSGFDPTLKAQLREIGG